MEMKNKLKDAIVSAESILRDEYGTLSLQGKELTGKNGKYLYKQYGVVDRIFKELGVSATIFVRDGSDFRRISTSITDASGNRAVDTVLDRNSSAYANVQSGKEYSGEAVIFDKTYLTEYRLLFASGGKDVIGILFVGIEKQ